MSCRPASGSAGRVAAAADGATVLPEPGRVAFAAGLVAPVTGPAGPCAQPAAIAAAASKARLPRVRSQSLTGH
jgi:hypothetical protein